MGRFKRFIQIEESDGLLEGTYPMWVRIFVGGLVIRLKSLNTKIQSEDDPIQQNKLISQQNQLLGYINGLGIGVSSNDKTLLNKMKSIRK